MIVKEKMTPFLPPYPHQKLREANKWSHACSTDVFNLTTTIYQIAREAFCLKTSVRCCTAFMPIIITRTINPMAIK